MNEEVIARYDTVLRALSCGYTVNVAAFQIFALDTARLYVKLYAWYPMLVSVHRILIRGSEERGSSRGMA